MVFQVCNTCGMYHAEKKPPAQCMRCGSKDFEAVKTNDRDFIDCMEVAIEIFKERQQSK